VPRWTTFNIGKWVFRLNISLQLAERATITQYLQHVHRFDLSSDVAVLQPTRS